MAVLSALGMIETKGLVAAIEAADAMVKAAAQLIKSNNLDKEDRQSYEWDQIKPQTFVIENLPFL